MQQRQATSMPFIMALTVYFLSQALAQLLGNQQDQYPAFQILGFTPQEFCLQTIIELCMQMVSLGQQIPQQ
jgi:hypothetical protein